MPADRCPTIADTWDDPEGVVLDVILFGGRRATNVPLVAQSRDWEHGVFMGATISSERTAAAEGTVGELRRDPFAMLPFCGYHMADYWRHWIEVGKAVRDAGAQPPAVFQVNWFRKDADGRFIWPGFGENVRVLAWILGRLEGSASASDTPLGFLPDAGSMNLDGLNVTDSQWHELFHIDAASQLAEAADAAAYFDGFGGRVPQALHEQLSTLTASLERLAAQRSETAARQR